MPKGSSLIRKPKTVEEMEIFNTPRLTEKQEKFCYEYMVDYNKRQAFIRAGFSPTGADQNAGTLFHHPLVRAKIKELREECMFNLKITRESQLQELQELKQCGDPSVIMKVIEIQNKMLGLNEAETTNLNLVGIKILTKDDDSNLLVNSLREVDEIIC